MTKTYKSADTVSTKYPSLDFLFEAKKALRLAESNLSNAEKELATVEAEVLAQAEVTNSVVVGPFTVIELSLETNNGRRYLGQGASKKSEYDSENPNLGYSIAYGRAQKSLLNKINNVTTREVFVG